MPIVRRLREAVHVERVVEIPEAAGGQVLKVLMNAEHEEAIRFLVAP